MFQQPKPEDQPAPKPQRPPEKKRKPAPTAPAVHLSFTLPPEPDDGFDPENPLGTPPDFSSEP